MARREGPAGQLDAFHPPFGKDCRAPSDAGGGPARTRSPVREVLSCRPAIRGRVRGREREMCGAGEPVAARAPTGAGGYRRMVHSLPACPRPGPAGKGQVQESPGGHCSPVCRLPVGHLPSAVIPRGTRQRQRRLPPCRANVPHAARARVPSRGAAGERRLSQVEIHGKREGLFLSPSALDTDSRGRRAAARWDAG